jgi:hypothetical protein
MSPEQVREFVKGVMALYATVKAGTGTDSEEGQPQP